MNHDGKIVIATFGYYRVRLWNADTGAVLISELSIQGRSTELYPSENSDLFATSGDDGVWIWHEENGAAVQHFANSAFLDFLPNGMLAMRTDSNQVVLWRYIVESRLGHLEAKQHAALFVNGEYGTVQHISAGKGHLVTLTDNGVVSVWRSDPPLLLAENDDAGACLRMPRLSGNGKVIAAIGSFQPAGGYIPAACEVEVPADGVILWNADTLAETKRLNLGEYGVLAEIALSNDGRRLLIGARAEKKKKEVANSDSADEGPLSYAVIEVASGKRIFPNDEKAVTSNVAVLSRNGEFLFTDDGNAVAKWRVADGSRVDVCKLGKDDVFNIAVNPENELLAVADQGGIIWSLDPETCTAKTTSLFKDTTPGDVINLRFKGALLAARSPLDGDEKLHSDLQVWSEPQDKVVGQLGEAHGIDTKQPFDFFGAKDRTILAQPQDYNGLADQLRIVDIAAKTNVIEFPIDSNGCCQPVGVQFFPDGKRMLTVWSERNWSRLRVWRVFPTVDDLLAFAKASVPECLSPQRRQSLGLDPDPPRWCVEMGKLPHTKMDAH